MLAEQNGRLSLFTTLALFACIVSLGIIFQYGHLEYLRYVISWDVFGYYLYLPASFIYHDLSLQDLTWVHDIQARYEPSDTLYQLFSTPHDGQNTWVIKYSMGAAVLYAPFFLIGHLLASATGYAADGFSIPYQIGILTAGYFYTGCGLLLVRKTLLHFFTDQITAAVLLLLVLGTNYFEYVAWEGAVLSHVLLFFVNAAILYFCIAWHKNPRLYLALILGTLIGLAAITRPFEIIWILVPFLWGVHSKQSLIVKIQLILKNGTHVLVLLAGLFAVGSVQLLYWKFATGHYLYFTYTEEFFFLKPFILKVLFSYKKGWLLYTPLMTFALAGFVFIYKKRREHFFALFLCFAGYLYLISSFEGWWYSSSFSNRALLETYSLLALPLGFALVTITKQKRIIKTFLLSILGLLFSLNLFQTWQYKQEIINKERMTKEYYWAVFLKTKVDEDSRQLLEVDRWAGPPKNLETNSNFNHRLLARFDFNKLENDEQQIHADTTLYLSRPSSLKMKSTLPFAATFEIPFSSLSNKEYAWIKITAGIYFFQKTDREKTLLVANFKHQGEIYEYKATAVDSANFRLNQWNRLVVYYLTPIIKSPSDTLQIYSWYNGNDSILLDDVSIGVYEPK